MVTVTIELACVDCGEKDCHVDAPHFWKAEGVAEPRIEMYPELAEALGEPQIIGSYERLHIIQ